MSRERWDPETENGINIKVYILGSKPNQQLLHAFLFGEIKGSVLWMHSALMNWTSSQDTEEEEHLDYTHQSNCNQERIRLWSHMLTCHISRSNNLFVCHEWSPSWWTFTEMQDKRKVCELRQIRELKKKRRRKEFPPADLHKHESLNFINAWKSPTFVSLVIPASWAWLWLNLCTKPGPQWKRLGLLLGPSMYVPDTKTTFTHQHRSWIRMFSWDSLPACELLVP